MVRLGQTVHLSCVKISTISKQTETSFHLSLVTYECHRVQPKQDSTWPKSPTIYLVPTLTPSPNGLKWDSTRPKSPRSSIGCVQKDFWAYGTFGANRSPISHQDLYFLQIDQNELPLGPRHLGVPSGTSKNDFWAYGMFGANRATIMNWH
jgi:hypothetical protein